MNRRGRGVVERTVRRLTVALATLLLCGAHGCTNVTGGAVELSWSLHGTDGKPVECVDAGVGRIRLIWQVGSTERFDAWPCTDNRAVTGFEIPEGDALLSVAPECVSGQPADLDFYQAPAPVARTVTEGDVVELHAIVVQLPTCTGTICTPKCTP
jgi:hypothetical protein